METVIDVRRLSAKKIYAGDMEFPYEAKQDWIDIPYVSFQGPVLVKLHYEILEDNSVEITGEVKFTLKGACSRCLKETSHDFTGEVDAYYVENGKGDDEAYSYTGGVVDLNPCLSEAIMLALPNVLVCGEDCKPLEWHEN